MGGMLLLWTAVAGQLARGAGGRCGPFTKKQGFDLVLPNKADQDGLDGRDSSRAACAHLTVDLWGATDTGDVDWTEGVLRKAAQVARATVLHGSFHSFTPNGGVSGALTLAEGHITIHTQSERSFAAVDVLMCGACDPRDTIPVLQTSFQPRRIQVTRFKRGCL